LGYSKILTIKKLSGWACRSRCCR